MKNRIIAGISLIALTLLAFRGIERRIVKKSIFNTERTGIVYVVVGKSDYELKIYDDEGWYATYPAVFGNRSLGDKLMEGDRKTPEGTFRIVSKRPHQKWHRIMLVDYPTKESWE